MKSVKVKRNELLKKLGENRATHIEEFQTAYDEFRIQLINKMSERLTGLHQGETFENPTSFSMTVPKSYQEEYDEAIEMLMMSTDDEVEISHDDFRKLVLDKWDWKRQFVASTSAYNNV